MHKEQLERLEVKNEILYLSLKQGGTADRDSPLICSTNQRHFFVANRRMQKKRGDGAAIDKILKMVYDYLMKRGKFL